MVIERLNGKKLIDNYREANGDYTNQIRVKYPYTHNFTKVTFTAIIFIICFLHRSRFKRIMDSIVYQTQVNGVPLLENILKVKLVFERLVPVLKENRK